MSGVFQQELLSLSQIAGVHSRGPAVWWPSPVPVRGGRVVRDLLRHLHPPQDCATLCHLLLQQLEVSRRGHGCYLLRRDPWVLWQVVKTQNQRWTNYSDSKLFSESRIFEFGLDYFRAQMLFKYSNLFPRISNIWNIFFILILNLSWELEPILICSFLFGTVIFTSFCAYYWINQFILLTSTFKPFDNRHTGVNISLSLDEMIEQLKLDGNDDAKFRLFTTNDNAANQKLGIKLSDYLQEDPCKIHTL